MWWYSMCTVLLSAVVLGDEVEESNTPHTEDDIRQKG